MKKGWLIILLFIASFSTVLCQQTTFQKIYSTYPLAGLEFRYEVIQTPDKGFLTGNYLLLLKTDSLGKKQWMEFVDSTIYLTFDYVNDGGFIAAGSFKIIKLNSNYAISWVKNVVNISSFIFYTIRETSDNGFILGGTTVNSDYLLVKTDSLGNVQWSKSYTTTQPLGFEFLTLSHDNGFLLSGTFSNGVLSDIFIVKVDSLGNLQWSKKINAPLSSTSYFNHIISTSDGNYALSGYRNLHRYILKIDSLGNKLWMKKYDCGIVGNATWLEETNDHGLIVAGNLQINTSGQTSLLMKTDSDGNLQWARALGGYSDIWAGCVKQTEDLGFIIGARVLGPGGGERFFLIKTDSLGHTNGCLEDTVSVIVTSLNDSAVSYPITETVVNISTVTDTIMLADTGGVIVLCTPVDIEEIENEKSEMEIYPNPSNGNLTFTSFYPLESLRLFDLSSRVVFSVDNILKNTYQCKLNVPDGIYVAEVFVKGNVYRRKMVVVR